MKNKKNPPRIITADPPWEIKTYSDKGRGRVQKYECMSESDLLALHPTIKDIAGRNAAIFMWTTGAHAEQAMALLAHWGFSFRTMMCWRKSNTAYGRWARSNGEFILIGVRGKFLAGLPGEWTTVFEGPREKRHSAKPERFQDLIDKRWPEIEKIELFARRERKGWRCIGGDLGSWITPTGIVATTPSPPIVAPPKKKPAKKRFSKGAQLDIEDAIANAK